MALPALVVLALVAVVAIAATGSTPTGSNATRPPSETLLDTLFTLGLVGVVAGGILLAYGLTQRKAIAREVASGRHGRTSLLAWLAFVALFTGISYWRLRDWEAPVEEPADELVVPGASPLTPTTADRPTDTMYEPGVTWLPIVVVLVLVTAAVVAYVVAGRRARRGRGSADEELAELLASVLDDTLDDLRAEKDPRRAIIAAYARLERVLAANGVARRPAETPDEYLRRVLAGLALQSDAVERLTRLFTRAKFSHHEVDSAMKEEAIGALEQVRDELRSAPEDVSEPTESLVTASGSTP